MYLFESRTPPGVRELKLITDAENTPDLARRTPPGVRELKLLKLVPRILVLKVAPLPGCVN